MRRPYSTTLSAAVTRPRRRSSPNTAMDASGVRSSWDTPATKPFRIRESCRSRRAARHVSSTPPIAITAISVDRTQLVSAFDCKTWAAAV